jgi:excisionase family DNA binding protein
MAIAPATENQLLTTPHTPDVSLEPGTLLTVHEVAELLKVPVSWVYERTRQRGMRRLPHLKVGKYLRFRTSEVQKFLETLRRA